MVKHCEGHVIFQDVEHELQENFLHKFLHYSFFYEIFIKLRSIFDPLKFIYWRLLHPNIVDMAIPYLSHNRSCIYY